MRIGVTSVKVLSPGARVSSAAPPRSDRLLCRRSPGNSRPPPPRPYPEPVRTVIIAGLWPPTENDVRGNAAAKRIAKKKSYIDTIFASFVAIVHVKGWTCPIVRIAQTVFARGHSFDYFFFSTKLLAATGKSAQYARVYVQRSSIAPYTSSSRVRLGPETIIYNILLLYREQWRQVYIIMYNIAGIYWWRTSAARTVFFILNGFMKEKKNRMCMRKYWVPEQ